MVESVLVLYVSNSVTSNTANYPKVLDNRSTVFTYSMATDWGGGNPCKIKSMENIYRSMYPDSRSQIIEGKKPNLSLLILKKSRFNHFYTDNHKYLPAVLTIF